MNQSTLYRPLHLWLLLFSFQIVFLYVSLDIRILQVIICQDVTRISIVILSVLMLTMCHGLYLSLRLSQQYCHFIFIKNEKKITDLGFAHDHYGESYIHNFYLVDQTESNNKALAAETLAENLRGAHQVGWFLTSLVVKLGLLGTVIGFVIMLSSISDLTELDLSGIKSLMQKMTQGMGVAMNTTMVGLVSSLFMGLQYLLLDRSADQLINETVQLSQHTELAKTTRL